ASTPAKVAAVGYLINLMLISFFDSFSATPETRSRSVMAVGEHYGGMGVEHRWAGEEKLCSKKAAGCSTALLRDVRFSPESGHSAAHIKCPHWAICAKSGHSLFVQALNYALAC